MATVHTESISVLIGDFAHLQLQVLRIINIIIIHTGWLRRQLVFNGWWLPPTQNEGSKRKNYFTADSHSSYKIVCQ